MVDEPDMTDDYSDIAPYPDAELPARLQLLCKDRELIDAASSLRFPQASKYFGLLVKPLIRHRIAREIHDIRDRKAWHQLLVHYIRRILESTTDGFTHSGVDRLPKDEPCLFVSNHRDIALDPVLVNYALWLNEKPTAQIAIGDNLLAMQLGAEFMRINDSFVILRSEKGIKAQYAAMNRTSSYIRQVLEQGQSIWIAQREGRSKDGVDQTDPAVLKMFALAYRDESKDINHVLTRVNLVPTTFTYELDPCGPRKALELAERERTGSYAKSEHEDRDSLVQGITGFKGRIHVAFDAPMRGDFQDADDLGEAIDQVMAKNRQPYPIFAEAKGMLDNASRSELVGRVADEFTKQWQSLQGRERELLLTQYANQAVG